MSQPHIHQVGTFDPVQAFAQTFVPLVRMIEGLRVDPEAIPQEETLRAAIRTLETLTAITEMASQSVMLGVSSLVDPELYAERRLEYQLEREARTPEEHIAHNLELLRSVAQFVPHEAVPDDGQSPE